MSSTHSSGASQWQAAFLQAAGKTDEPRTRQLLRECEDRTDRIRDTLRIALQKVAGRGHESLTQYLLEEGAAVNTVLGDEVPPLWRAAEQGRLRIVKLLLDHGADTEARDKLERTPIFAAALKGQWKTIKVLVEAGADVNIRDGNGQTIILSLASERSEKQIIGRSEVVDALLAAGVELEVRDKDGRTALLWASSLGKLDFVRSLLACRRPADITATNLRGKTALHLAAENNNVATVTLLLEYGASPQARSDGGWTAFHNAAEKGHSDIVYLLLRQNVDVNTILSNGMTALHWAARNGHLNTVNLLLEQNGVKRNIKDFQDITPMLGAAENGHLDIVKLLSPADDGSLLSDNACGACKGFQATVVDFGMENRPMNHVKYSVFDLLYGQTKNCEKPLVSTIVRNIPAKPSFRWVHLPANNMSWVETLITKHFVENSAKDVEGFKALEKTFGQKHAGPMIHSHFMRPHCSRMPPTAKGPSYPKSDESGAESMAQSGVIVPSSLGENPPNTTQTPDKATTQSYKRGGKAGKSTDSPQDKIKKSFARINSLATDSTSVKDSRSIQSGRTLSKPQSRRREQKGNIALYLPYLHYETDERRKEMSNAIQSTHLNTREPIYIAQTGSCDEQLVNAYLHSTHNLHIRRTLDQYYYHAISTEERDQDQVVYRYTRDKKQEIKVFMVDQLWMWILDADLIVTCFPQRWKQPKNDPLNVLDGIIEDMSSKTHSPPKSVYDLAMLVTGRCCGVFDRHRLGGEDYQFLDMFESSIGEVTEKETKLFKRFNDASGLAAHWLRRQRHIRPRARDGDSVDDDLESDPTFVDTLLDIGDETALLAETKDIRDELSMITMVLQQQCSILDDLSQSIREEFKGNRYQQRQAEIKRKFREQQKLIEVHLKDVERMDKQAEGIYTSLTHLLDLKQKHANAFEARFARDQAAFTGRQGQTIMVFTIVTAIFLPMSFLASLFTIPVREFPHAADGVPSLSLGYVSKFVFGIGLAISLPSIAIAFAVDDIRLWIRKASKQLRATKMSAETKSSDSQVNQDDTKHLLDADPNSNQRPLRQRRWYLGDRWHNKTEDGEISQKTSDVEKADHSRF